MMFNWIKGILFGGTLRIAQNYIWSGELAGGGCHGDNLIFATGKDLWSLKSMSCNFQYLSTFRKEAGQSPVLLHSFRGVLPPEIFAFGKPAKLD